MEEPDGPEQDPEQETPSPGEGAEGADATGADATGTSATADEDGDSQAIGARLRRGREQAGLALADIAQKTKIRPGILTDIENGAYDRLPALTYTIGFVKAYARTVGIDPAEAGDCYRRESQRLDPQPGIVDLQPLEARRLPSPRLAFVATLVLVLVLAGFWAWGAGLFTPGPTPPTPAAPAAPAAPEAPAGESAATAPEGTTAPVAAPAASGIVTLTARQEVWLRISEGNDVFFTGILEPGRVLALPAGHGWVLRTALAGALEVKVGDEVLPPLGGPIEQLYDLSLRPEDLLARKNGAQPARPEPEPGQDAPNAAPPATPSATGGFQPG